MREALVRRISMDPIVEALRASVGATDGTIMARVAVEAGARRLTDRPYLTMYATDNTGIYGQRMTAWHPEFEWDGIRFCVGIGRTEAEAAQDLNQVRYELIRKLLEAELPVPEPADAESHLTDGLTTASNCEELGT